VIANDVAHKETCSCGHGKLLRSSRGVKYCDSMSVCLCVCLSSARIYRKPRYQIFCTWLPVAAAQFSDGSVIRYILPVLWIMSCFYIMQGVGQNHMFLPIH